MISIIGSGKVGSAIAFLAAHDSLDDILLVNRHKEKALGHAMDILNCIPSDSPISVTAGDYSQIHNSDVLVIAASTATYTTSRTQILLEQFQMMKDIVKKIKDNANPSAQILLITNPIDPLAYFVQKEIGFFKNVIGVASSLDSSRLRFLLAKELALQQNKITNVMVLGEHGNSMVPIFSKARCNNKPVTDLLNSEQLEKITEDLRGYWKILRGFKGPSVYGIAKNTYDVLKSIISNKELLIPASVLLNGEYGISDVCMGVPIKINKETKIQEIDLENSELDALQKSANVIKKHIKELGY